MKKRLLAILLTVCMVVSMAPVAFAAGSVFTDVKADDWFADEVEYVYVNGLMQGVGNSKFDPNGTTTRAMIVTILWRLEGEPAVNYAMNFEDVESEQWYTEAIRWAASEKIVEGYGNGKFGTNDAITREQMVTIMYRYAQYKGYDVSVGENTNILSYGDAFDVAEWAIPAMQWACGSGMIQGIADGSTMNLQPQGNATRAQAAAIFYRFIEEVVNAAPTTHTVTFMWNYGDKGVYAEIKVEDGQTVGTLSNPYRSGYDFAGWYTANGALFTLSTKVTADIVVYAEWTEDEYVPPIVIPPVHTHFWTAGTPVPPTCTEQGYTPYTCYCGNSKNDNFVDALDHAWGDWTADDSSTHTHICDRDNAHTETENHSYDEGETVCECGYIKDSVAKIGDAYYTSAQAALDAAKDGDTIVLFEGNHGDLVFRITEDSELTGYYYIMGNYDSSYYGKEDWQYAKRTINGLTITGVEGAVIDSFTVAADRDDAGNAKGTRNNMFEITNLTISNLTVANSISFNTSDVTVATSAYEADNAIVPHVKLDGLTIDNCKTTTGGDTSNAGQRKLLGIANTGSVSNAKNIVVKNCVVTDMYQGVYIVDGENVRIEGNSFSGLTHNSIHINDLCSGTIIVSGNTIDNVSDRPIRFNGVQSGTVAITNNTITNSTGDNGQYFKASAMASDVTLTWENNTIDGVDIVLITSGTDVIGMKAEN